MRSRTRGWSNSIEYSCTRIRIWTVKKMASPASTTSEIYETFKGFPGSTLINKEFVKNITADPCMFLDIYNFDIL